MKLRFALFLIFYGIFAICQGNELKTDFNSAQEIMTSPISTASSSTKFVSQTRPKAVFFGHNLSQTSDVLVKNQMSFGSQVIAYGFSDRITLGTSPWLINDYEMASLFLRYKSSSNRAFQFSYFKSCFKNDNCVENESFYFDQEFESQEVSVDLVSSKMGYSMEALWLTMIDRFDLTDQYTIEINYGLQYYVNQAMPFSLKRPSEQPQPWQFHISSLHKVNVIDAFNWYTEVGFLAPTDNNPYLHFGGSIGYKKTNFETHIGFSVTSQFEALFNPTRRVDLQQQMRNRRMPYGTKLETSRVYNNDYAIHPEFSLQYSW